MDGRRRGGRERLTGSRRSRGCARMADTAARPSHASLIAHGDGRSSVRRLAEVAGCLTRSSPPPERIGGHQPRVQYDPHLRPDADRRVPAARRRDVLVTRPATLLAGPLLPSLYRRPVPGRSSSRAGHRRGPGARGGPGHRRRRADGLAHRPDGLRRAGAGDLGADPRAFQPAAGTGGVAGPSKRELEVGRLLAIGAKDRPSPGTRHVGELLRAQRPRDPRGLGARSRTEAVLAMSGRAAWPRSR